MKEISDSIIIIAVVAICSFLTRALPFLVFKKTKTLPKRIMYLGNVLPMAIMFCLIVYCIRDISLFTYPYGLAQILGILCVVILHLWKRNNMISILGGTIFYMVLVQLVFI